MAHQIEIVKDRPMLLSAFRPHSYTVLVDNQIVAEGKGYRRHSGQDAERWRFDRPTGASPLCRAGSMSLVATDPSIPAPRKLFHSATDERDRSAEEDPVDLCRPGFLLGLR